MNEKQFDATIVIGFAAREISDNALLIVKALASKDPALKARLEAIDSEASSELGAELAKVMYEAACQRLVSKGMAYPPLRPEHFLGVEAAAEMARAKAAAS